MLSKAPVVIDVIILSDTDSKSKQVMTENAIRSLFSSEDPLFNRFNVTIVESCPAFPGYDAKYGRTIHPGCKFGFNKFMNVGIRAGSAEYVCLCNNDVVFHPGWATHMLAAMNQDPSIESCCPYCGIYHPTRGIKPDALPILGYHFEVLIGWCILIKRSVIERIGPLDERITFWFAERDYGNTLENCGIRHALIPAARVDHLRSQSLKDCGAVTRHRMTSLQQCYFDYKWQHHSRVRYYWQVTSFFPRLFLANIRAGCPGLRNRLRGALGGRSQA
jgi:GT2 family glycosyltransferase